MVCVALAACWHGGFSGSGYGVRGGSFHQAKDVIEPLTCGAVAGDSDTKTVDGNGTAHLEVPKTGRKLAELEVPRGAVSSETEFTLSIPANSGRVIAEVTARTVAGSVPVTEFAEPLTLTLRQRGDCVVREPRTQYHITVYRIDSTAGADTFLARVGGAQSKSGGPGTTRVEIDHLSGYILAQGIVR
jgi:hypothetical protein